MMQTRGNACTPLEEAEATYRRIERLEEEVEQLRHEIDSCLGHKMASLVCFSGEWDRLFAAFTIANGLLASGYEVHMFFTFWGATALRKPGSFNPKNKSLMQKALSLMLPDRVEKAPLSKMNFAGMGKIMLGKLMMQKGVESIEALMNEARDLGVHFHLCDTSLSLFGWDSGELIDAERSDWCGVMTFLSLAEKSRIVLFI